jgi:hypothetical protein
VLVVGSADDVDDNALAQDFVDSFQTALIRDRVWHTQASGLTRCASRRSRSKPLGVAPTGRTNRRLALLVKWEPNLPITRLRRARQRVRPP